MHIEQQLIARITIELRQISYMYIIIINALLDISLERNDIISLAWYIHFV